MGSSSSSKKSPTVELDEHLFDGGPEWEERTVGTFCTKSGDQVGFRGWRRKGDVTGLLFLLHGLHEHGGRYAPVAHWFAEKGMSVFAHDHFAHGRSYGERALITDHSRLVSDAIEFITAKANTEAHANLPVYVIGHSMGSLVATATIAALQRPAADSGSGGIGGPSVLGDRLRKVAFCGCPLYPGPGSASPLGIKALYPITRVAPLLRGLARTFAALDPGGPNTPIDNMNLSHDPAVRERIDKDALHFTGKVKNKTGLEFIRLAAQARQAAPSVTIPAMIFHGKDDIIAYPAGSLELQTLLGSEIKPLKLYDNAFHEVLNEPFYPGVCASVHSFLLE